MRICSGAGCTRAVQDSVTFCHECKPVPKADGDGIRSHVPAGKAGPSRSGGLKLSGNQRAYTDECQREYQGKLWREGTRHRVLQRYPFCVDCKTAVSAVADHKIPARIVVTACRAERMFPMEKLPGFHLMANLQGLCHSCHNKKTAGEEGKDWTEALEELLAKYRDRNWFAF